MVSKGWPRGLYPTRRLIVVGVTVSQPLTVTRVAACLLRLGTKGEGPRRKGNFFLATTFSPGTNLESHPHPLSRHVSCSKNTRTIKASHECCYSKQLPHCDTPVMELSSSAEKASTCMGVRGISFGRKEHGRKKRRFVKNE